MTGLIKIDSFVRFVWMVRLFSRSWFEMQFRLVKPKMNFVKTSPDGLGEATERDVDGFGDDVGDPETVLGLGRTFDFGVLGANISKAVNLSDFKLLLKFSLTLASIFSNFSLDFSNFSCLSFLSPLR